MRVREWSLGCEHWRVRSSCFAVTLELLVEGAASICLDRHCVVVGSDVRVGKLLAVRLGIGDHRLAGDERVLGWQWASHGSARVRLKWESSLVPDVDRSHLLTMTSMASAVCVAELVRLHDVDVSWCVVCNAGSLVSAPGAV